MLDRHGCLLGTARSPHLQIARIRMHAAVLIEDGILVGVIGCSGTHQFADQSRLAGKTGSRENQRMALPSDHAGMHKDAIWRVVGDVDHQVAGKLLQSRLQVRMFRNYLFVNGEAKATGVLGSQQRELSCSRGPRSANLSA